MMACMAPYEYRRNHAYITKEKQSVVKSEGCGLGWGSETNRYNNEQAGWKKRNGLDGIR